MESQLHPPGSLIRTLGRLETMGIRCHKYCGSLVTTYSLHVQSDVIIKEEEIKMALLHIFRKFQFLRCCVDQLDGKYVFREMKKEIIDYEIVEEHNWQIIHEELLCKCYDLNNGPLWCCRIILMSDESLKKLGLPLETKAHFYTFAFSLLHSITDGISNIKMLGNFLRILNLIIEKKDVHEEKIFVFSNMDEVMPQNERSIKLKDIFPMLTELYYFFFRRKTLFYESYHCPPSFEGKTKIIYTLFNEDDTARILDKCKKEKVTVLGAFTLCAACAMARMIEEAYGEQNIIHLKIGHAVNIRSYVDKNMSNAYGPYFVLLIHKIVVFSNSMEKFWECARQYTKELHTDLNNGKLFQSKRVLENCFRFPEMVIDSQKGSDVNCKYEFGTTNLGKIDYAFEDCGKSVQPVSLCRSTAFQYMGSGFCHSLHTLRGRFTYSLEYYTNVINENVAKTYNESILEILKSMT